MSFSEAASDDVKPLNADEQRLLLQLQRRAQLGSVLHHEFDDGVSDWSLASEPGWVQCLMHPSAGWLISRRPILIILEDIIRLLWPLCQKPLCRVEHWECLWARPRRVRSLPFLQASPTWKPGVRPWLSLVSSLAKIWPMVKDGFVVELFLGGFWVCDWRREPAAFDSRHQGGATFLKVGHRSTQVRSHCFAVNRYDHCRERSMTSISDFRIVPVLTPQHLLCQPFAALPTWESQGSVETLMPCPVGGKATEVLRCLLEEVHSGSLELTFPVRYQHIYIYRARERERYIYIYRDIL